MGILKKVDDNLEKWILMVLLTVLCCLTMFQTIMRYVMGRALPWPEEVTRYCLVLMCFFTVPYCIRHQLNLRIDMITRNFKPALMRIVNILVYLTMLFSLSLFAKAGIKIVKDAYSIHSMASSFPVPLYVIYSVCLGALVLGLLRLVQMIILEIRSVGKGE